MTRLVGWQEPFYAFIEEAHRREFSYGVFDCCLFAADAVRVITGVDYAAELRGYTSKFEAYRIVAEYGSLEAMITALLGREPVHVSRAMVGDVLLGPGPLVEGESGETCGVCTSTKWLAPQGKGLRAVDRSLARLAWRIE